MEDNTFSTAAAFNVIIREDPDNNLVVVPEGTIVDDLSTNGTNVVVFEYVIQATSPR